MSDMLKTTDRPEIVQEVLKEVKAIGATSREANEKLQNEINELKHAQKASDESKDVLIKEKIDKLAESIVTRQEQIEDELTKRVDNVETVLQRLPKSNDPSSLSTEDKKDVIHFKKCLEMNRGNTSKFNEEIKDSDVELYKKYTKAFSKYLLVGKDRLTPDEQRDMLIGEEVNGGVFVPRLMSEEIIKKKYDRNRMRQVASIITISSDSIEYPVEFDDVGSGWIGEIESRPETSTPQVQSKEFQVFEQYARPIVSRRLLQDSSIDIEDWLSGYVSNRLSREEGKTHFVGTGVKQPRGILSYPNGTGINDVVQVNSGATFGTDSFYNTLYDMPADYITLANGWFLNKKTVRDALLLKDLNGYPIFNSANIDTAGLPTILGISVYMATSMPVVAANALAIAVGYWPDAYQIVDRLGITVIRDIYTKKETGQVDYLFTTRTGGGVKNPQALRLGKIA